MHQAWAMPGLPNSITGWAPGVIGFYMNSSIGIMHQPQRYACIVHVDIGFLPEKTSVAPRKPEKPYNFRVEYASYMSMGPILAISGRTSTPQLLNSSSHPTAYGILSRIEPVVSYPEFPDGNQLTQNSNSKLSSFSLPASRS